SCADNTVTAFHEERLLARAAHSRGHEVLELGEGSGRPGQHSRLHHGGVTEKPPEKHVPLLRAFQTGGYFRVLGNQVKHCANVQKVEERQHLWNNKARSRGLSRPCLREKKKKPEPRNQEALLFSHLRQGESKTLPRAVPGARQASQEPLKRVADVGRAEAVELRKVHLFQGDAGRVHVFGSGRAIGAAVGFGRAALAPLAAAVSVLHYAVAAVVRLRFRFHARAGARPPFARGGGAGVDQAVPVAVREAGAVGALEGVQRADKVRGGAQPLPLVEGGEVPEQLESGVHGFFCLASLRLSVSFLSLSVSST
ncbi:MAG: hypothetical protein BJ554DRAFT_3576, partial [Olpidium bornovanus]